jgi:hypothetical protein
MILILLYNLKLMGKINNNLLNYYLLNLLLDLLLKLKIRKDFLF